jgi:hypothetical protein
MLPGRCPWELSGRKLETEVKKVTNSEEDTATTRTVAVVNEAFARRFFKNGREYR